MIAVQHFDEADRMDLVAGDRVIVLDGRPENFWWRGQNRRTSEIASFPREIVRLTRGLGSELCHAILELFIFLLLLQMMQILDSLGNFI